MRTQSADRPQACDAEPEILDDDAFGYFQLQPFRCLRLIIERDYEFNPAGFRV
jgi:hypothetical protein